MNGQGTTQENNWHIPPGGLPGQMKKNPAVGQKPTTGNLTINTTALVLHCASY